MRGDRPGNKRGCPHRGRATPHARGSTDAYYFSHDANAGYPACAGIDRELLFSDSVLGGLPRMRGDRPSLTSLRLCIPSATPHARGSTSPRLAATRPLSGYPACAGIDHSDLWYEGMHRRLPRMRGDRPFSMSCCVFFVLATPHARGSTPSIHAAFCAYCGYPACAGIDPFAPAPCNDPLGLPRMRGDRPLPGSSRAAAAMATPHARGST